MDVTIPKKKNKKNLETKSKWQTLWTERKHRATIEYLLMR